jgi:hypothetical protein
MTKKVIMMISLEEIKLESTPESAGPTRNAIPKAAPINPIFFIRSVGLDISAIYACITENPAPPSHQTNRANRNTRNSGVHHAKAERK